jgi:quercetin dioxygenase-like cupin family protein
MSRNRFVRILPVLIMGATVAACSGGDGQPATSPSSGAATPADPSTETVSLLRQKVLPNVRDKTFTSAIVNFPPAARAVPHRHGDAFVYAYVLDGSVRSRVAGQPADTYRTGQDWVEQPGAHHLLTENVSLSEPARLLVVFISTTGQRLKIDDPH